MPHFYLIEKLRESLPAEYSFHVSGIGEIFEVLFSAYFIQKGFQIN